VAHPALEGARFHHIGQAVADIGRHVEEFLRPVFGDLPITDAVADPIQKVRVCFVTMPGGVTIELVEPHGEGSPVRDIVGSSRGGLYHVCYEVPDLDRALAALRRMRCLPLGRPVPAAAFEGRRIVFMITPQRDLIELLEGHGLPNPLREATGAPIS
jgi:methylmalonyl-CoA/ethylmalonyl-CoA epimerase